MKWASASEAKTNFSALLKVAEAGEEVIVTRRGTPVARIPPMKAAKERSFANDEGLGFVADSFDEPLPVVLLEQYYQ
jgi:prevent-host-death family protein